MLQNKTFIAILNPMEKGKITIDKLAEMSQEQFSSIEERFDAVDQRFDAVDQRFDRLEAGQNRLESGLKHVLSVVLQIPSKKTFEKLETKVDQIDVRLTTVEKKIRN